MEYSNDLGEGVGEREGNIKKKLKLLNGFI